MVNSASVPVDRETSLSVPPGKHRHLDKIVAAGPARFESNVVAARIDGIDAGRSRGGIDGRNHVGDGGGIAQRDLLRSQRPGHDDLVIAGKRRAADREGGGGGRGRRGGLHV
jgi:hypothetical protein